MSDTRYPRKHGADRANMGLRAGQCRLGSCESCRAKQKMPAEEITQTPLVVNARRRWAALGQQSLMNMDFERFRSIF